MRYLTTGLGGFWKGQDGSIYPDPSRMTEIACSVSAEEGEEPPTVYEVAEEALNRIKAYAQSKGAEIEQGTAEVSYTRDRRGMAFRVDVVQPGPAF